MDNPSFSREFSVDLPERQRFDSETKLISESLNVSGSQEGNFGEQEFYATHFDEEINLEVNYLNRFPRDSVSTVISTPIIQLQGFLSDARSSVQLGPDDLSQLSLPDIEVPRDDYPKSQLPSKLARFMQSFPVNLFTMICMLTDAGIIVADVTLYGLFPAKLESLQLNSTNDSFSLSSDRDIYVMIDFSLGSYLLIELFFCIIASGLYQFVCTWQNVLDALVTVTTFTFSLLDLIVEDTSVVEGIILKILHVARLFRLFRIIRVFRLYTMQKRLAKSTRHLVSQNKRRYQHDGFDLDLTYITDKVIAMSFPSAGQMSLYRNPITEVARFLDTKHHGHYKVYNLCDEHSYDPSYFHGRVEHYPFKDHNVPSVKQMIEFTASVRTWLEADPNNVIAVHCKGGKGRTGTMICVWLVEAGIFHSATDSLVYFGSRRTDTTCDQTFQGVETPSQCRYVEYYERIKENRGVLQAETTLYPKKIRIEGISKIGKGNGSDLIIEIRSIDRESSIIYKLDLRNKRNRDFSYSYIPSERAIECTLGKCPSLQRDIQVIVKSHSRAAPKGCLGALFYFWFHCGFVHEYKLRLKREQLDNPHKPRSWRYFGPDFAVELEFTPPAHFFLESSTKYKTYAVREPADVCLQAFDL